MARGGSTGDGGYTGMVILAAVSMLIGVTCLVLEAGEYDWQSKPASAAPKATIPPLAKPAGQAALDLPPPAVAVEPAKPAPLPAAEPAKPAVATAPPAPLPPPDLTAKPAPPAPAGPTPSPLVVPRPAPVTPATAPPAADAPTPSPLNLRPGGR
jgi:hypothetical protein